MCEFVEICQGGSQLEYRSERQVVGRDAGKGVVVGVEVGVRVRDVTG